MLVMCPGLPFSICVVAALAYQYFDLIMQPINCAKVKMHAIALLQAKLRQSTSKAQLRECMRFCLHMY